jgi:hypothetical protein
LHQLNRFVKLMIDQTRQCLQKIPDRLAGKTRVREEMPRLKLSFADVDELGVALGGKLGEGHGNLDELSRPITMNLKTSSRFLSSAGKFSARVTAVSGAQRISPGVCRDPARAGPTTDAQLRLPALFPC